MSEQPRCGESESQVSEESAELIRGFVEHSPFTADFGLKIDELAADRCRLRLPFNESLATYGQVVHGGAIATLIDLAATIAAWSNPRHPPTGGATVDLTVHYLRPAEGEDLLARAQVLRRGGALCSLEVEVDGAESGDLVAKGVVAYKLQTSDGEGK